MKSQGMAPGVRIVSPYFTNRFTVVRPIRRVNVDLTQGMLETLERSPRRNVSRQAAIKTVLERSEERCAGRKSG